MCKKLVCLISFVLVLGMVSGAAADETIILSTYANETVGGTLSIDSTDLAEASGDLVDGPVTATMFLQREDFLNGNYNVNALCVLDNGNVLLSTLYGARFGSNSLFAYGSNVVEFNPGDTTVDGLAAGEARLFFNGQSLIGGGQKGVDAVHYIGSNDIIISVQYTGCEIPCGSGNTYNRSDLIEITGDLTSSNCADISASLYLDHNLFGNNADLTGVSIKDGKLILSTGYNSSIGGLSFRKGDVVEYDPVSDTATLYADRDTLFGGDAWVDAVHVIGAPPGPPGQASNPSPANTATNVSTTADLSWTAGSGATSHDVYFGTDSTPDSGESKGNQTSTTYDPGTMANDTTYYWRIDEVNAQGTTTGDVWSFTTESEAPPPPPDQASNPSPANGATNVNTTADLSWTAGSGATSHDVYFGTSSPGTFQGNQTSTTYDPATMTEDTTYYWRIDEVNANGTTTGVVWSFTTTTAVAEEETIILSTYVNETVGGTLSIDSTDLAEATGDFVDGPVTATMFLQREDFINGNYNVDAFCVLDNGNVLLSTLYGALFGSNSFYAYAANVVEFNPGDTTVDGLAAGEARLFFNGQSLIGGGNRNLDAVHCIGSNDIIISVTYTGCEIPCGSGNTYDRGDLVEITGDLTSSNCDDVSASLYFDHNLFGSSANLSGACVKDDGKLILSTDYNSSIGGVSFRKGDLVEYDPSTGTATLYADRDTLFGGEAWVDAVHVVTIPGQASNPNPADEATGVAIDAVLSWEAGDWADSHDVYLGTNYDSVADADHSSPEFMGNQTATSYDPDLQYNTTYYWSVDEIDETNVWPGPVWSFTTLSAPGQAGDPSPDDGITEVSINENLSWTAGSGATSHDVYFGTSSPPAFIHNQTATTYDPGTMNAGTTYYWRIDEKNEAGTTTGVVWSFTTLPLPGQASSPSPANGATDVSISADLSWTAGSDTDSHDVYFGTDSMPDSGEFQGNQAGTTFDPGTMAYNTTYYWRIDEVNAGGTTTGNVWSLTTEEPPPPPGQAGNPSPSNGATDVDIEADLSWSAGSGATSHDVYFGTDSTPDSTEFKGNQAGTTYDPGTMAYETTYYWRIDEVNAAGTTTGSVWSFTTEEPQPPGQASSPSPSHQAGSVSVNANLLWSAGSGATSHDVYFGTDSTPDSGESKGNQTSTTYDPGTMDYETTYYWRIDEKNAYGTTTGDVWSFTTRPEGPVMAFPGAEGFGADTIGGRGGTVIKVTNRNDDGAGSFREACEASGPRIVVFEVSGTISLSEGIDITDPYITIAGQTSPGGICIKNWPLEVRSHDIVIRHMRFRPGTGGGGTDVRVEAVHNRGEGGAFYNVILDHCSMSWATDENVDMGGDATDLTLQRCIISEGLYEAGFEGHHSCGFLDNNGNTDITIHHCIFAHNDERNPRIHGGLVDFRNNIVYDFHSWCGSIGHYGGGNAIYLNWVGNYVKNGPEGSTKYSVGLRGDNECYLGVYVDDNIGPYRPDGTGDEWLVVNNPDLADEQATSPYDVPSVTTDSVFDVYDDVLADCGATLPQQDSVDERIIDDVLNGTGGFIDNPSEVGGWPNLSGGSPPTDSDDDGMPDDWETARGLNPDVDDSAGDRDSDGYTNIEEYINGIPW